MVTRQQLEGQWNQVKGRIQERWGQFTDNDLQELEGNATQLVGAIQQKTGESRQAIEDFLEEVVAEGSSMLNKATDTAREYAARASQTVHENYDRVAENVREGYAQANECVRRHPMESLGVAFGAGIITGVIVGLVLKGRS
jgi:uncharacterized protein YjbJ (UPF0337 family)